jgi:hypothetical protein
MRKTPPEDQDAVTTPAARHLKEHTMTALRRLALTLAAVTTPVLYLIIETAPSGHNWLK